jgi:hypothetical protein
MIAAANHPPAISNTAGSRSLEMVRLDRAFIPVLLRVSGFFWGALAGLGLSWLS